MSVTVVGSLNEDVLVTVDRLPGRGETVIGSATRVAPGGKGANQAAAAGRLGPGVTMVGRVGDDPAGERQRTALADVGVDVHLVHRTPGELTGTATIPVEAAGGENLIVVVPGANAALGPADVDVPEVHRADVVLLQLENPPATVLAAAAAARGTVVLNPAPARPLPAELLARVDVLVPNEHELRALTGDDGGSGGPARLVGPSRRLGAGAVVVTLGGDGALVVPATGPALLQAPPPVRPVDTTGAGDCFCGALAQALAGGDDLPAAVRWAVTAAAASTTGAGARGALPDAGTVRELLARTPAAVPVGPEGLPGAAPGNGPDMTESAPQRASDVDQPDGGGPSRGEEGTGRTPHPDQPAEGADPDAETPGIDPDTRVTGV
ncbi:ribokinase [Modestobacter sp. URMC 112]